MGLRGNNRLFRSFGHAIDGIRDVFTYEKNTHIHLVVGVLCIIGAGLLRFPLVHWLILLLVIAGVFALEMINSAIERTVDLVTEDVHPLAKRAKDAAAAAVLVYCLFAIVIGLLLFVPPLTRLLFEVVQ